jgi:hypothetical protein
VPARYIKLVERIKEVLPQDSLDELGRSVFFIRRLRQVTASSLVWATVLSRFADKPGFEQARQWFIRLTGKSVHRRPFQIRFKAAQAVALFSAAFERAVTPWRQPSRPKPRHALAKHFPDVVLCDSSLIQVDDSLRRHFKGVAAQAAVKLFLTVSAFGLLPLSARLYPGHRHDMTVDLPLQHFARATLFMFDKGFIAWRRLLALQQAGMNLLCPTRYNANPLVVAVHHAPKRMRDALRRHPKGVRLRDLLPIHKRISKSLDFDVIVGPLRGGVRLRLVIIPGPKRKQRLYLTTLSTRFWPPRALAEIYRLRWQIELVFKELKQHLSLDFVPTADRYAAQAFIWASLLALIVSRACADCLAGLRHLIGLNSSLRLAPLSKALGNHLALLACALMRPRSAAVLKILAIQLVSEAGYHPPRRADSFRRIPPLLTPA